MLTAMMLSLATFFSILGLPLSTALDLNSPQSVRDAAASAAYGLQKFYDGNSTGVLGKFPFPPYYWWESGAAWGGMINYWHFTGDDSYNNVTYNALVSQIGPSGDFVMPVEVFDEVSGLRSPVNFPSLLLNSHRQGNDDQAFWALAAMSAAEYGFPPPPSPYECWTEICVNVFNDYVDRWYNMSDTCGGGLKWQYTSANVGYHYKNSISNGGFFQLSTRLARMTGNQTYLDWANKIWDWSVTIGLIDDKFNVFDGTDDTINCTGVNHNRWTYNAAIYLYGVAVMQNCTNGSSVWHERTSGLLNNIFSTFFSPFPNSTAIMYESLCEPTSACNNDQFSMKAYLSRWLALTSILVPSTSESIYSHLRASAIGAVAACSGLDGGPDGKHCGSKWYIGTNDGMTGMGQQLSAMEIMYALLSNETAPPMQET